MARETAPAPVLEPVQPTAPDTAPVKDGETPAAKLPPVPPLSKEGFKVDASGVRLGEYKSPDGMLTIRTN